MSWEIDEKFNIEIAHGQLGRLEGKPCHSQQGDMGLRIKLSW